VEAEDQDQGLELMDSRQEVKIIAELDGEG